MRCEGTVPYVPLLAEWTRADDVSFVGRALEEGRLCGAAIGV